VKTLAFVPGLFIATVGAVGVLAPSILVWIAHHSETTAAFYFVATVRIAFGLVLISAASTSRAPNAVRVLGYVILVAGIVTGLMGLLGIGRGRAMIESWVQQGAGVIRLTGVLLFALGGFIAHACAPVRRAA